MANVRLRWWGYRVRLTHREVDAIMGFVESGTTRTALEGLLVAGGVANPVADAIGAGLALVMTADAFWIFSQDDGNGVVLAVFWTGTLFWVENPRGT
jgi:hypothetical protein